MAYSFVNPSGASPQPGFSTGPAMPHGSVVLNVTGQFDLLSDRVLRYRNARNRIKPGTSAKDPLVQEIAMGDIVFRVPDTLPGARDRPHSVPSVTVFSCFNLLPPRVACDACVIGVAESRFQPGVHDSNAQNPVFAAAAHGVRTIRNNGQHTFEPGDIVLALPPTDSYEQRRQTGNVMSTELAASLSVTSDRVVAVITPLRQTAYSAFFGNPRFGNTFDRAIHSALATVQRAGGGHAITGFGFDRGNIHTLTSRILGELGLGGEQLEVRPHFGLRVALLCAQAEWAIKENAAFGGEYSTQLSTELTRVPGFVPFMDAVYGKFSDQDVAACIRDMLNKYSAAYKVVTPLEEEVKQGGAAAVAVKDARVRRASVASFFTELIIAHADFIARYLRGKVVGKCLAHSLPNDNLIVYVNPAIGI